MNAFRQAIPELAKLRTACIMDGGPLTLARDFKALKVDILSTGKDHVSPDLVADCQRRGIQVWVWTVNSLHFMERLLVSVRGRPPSYACRGGVGGGGGRRMFLLFLADEERQRAHTFKCCSCLLHLSCVFCSWFLVLL